MVGKLIFTAGLTAAMVGFVATPASAQTKGVAPAVNPSSSAKVSDETASGEVRRIQKDLNKITLRHGEIKSIDMPSMTMVFTVRDPKLLKQVKVGDKVKFAAEMKGTELFVTSIRKVE